MKQLVVNKLDGGYVVQTIDDGKQVAQAVATTFTAATAIGFVFFEGATDEPPTYYDDNVIDGDFIPADKAEVTVPPPLLRRRGRPRKDTTV